MARNKKYSRKRSSKRRHQKGGAAAATVEDLKKQNEDAEKEYDAKALEYVTRLGEFRNARAELYALMEDLRKNEGAPSFIEFEKDIDTATNLNMKSLRAVSGSA